MVLVCYDEVLSDDLDAFCIEPMMMLSYMVTQILKTSCTIMEPMMVVFMIDPNDPYCGHLIEHFEIKRGDDVLKATKFEEALILSWR